MTLSHGTWRARAYVIHKKTPNAGGRVWGVSFEIFEAVTNAHASRRMKAWAVDGCYRSSRLRLRRRTGRRLHGADKLAEQLGCAATSGDNLLSRNELSLYRVAIRARCGFNVVERRMQLSSRLPD